MNNELTHNLILIRTKIEVLSSHHFNMPICRLFYESAFVLGVFTWRRASPLCRDPASQLNSLSKFVFIYMRGGEISPRRAGNFPINALKRAGLPGGLASQSSVHTTKVVLTSIF